MIRYIFLDMKAAAPVIDLSIVDDVDFASSLEVAPFPALLTHLPTGFSLNLLSGTICNRTDESPIQVTRLNSSHMRFEMTVDEGAAEGRKGIIQCPESGICFDLLGGAWPDEGLASKAFVRKCFNSAADHLIGVRATKAELERDGS